MTTRRNFKGGADRGNKLSEAHPRGFRGASYGAAGPVMRIDPQTGTKTEAPAVAPAYAKYVAAKQAAGKPAKSYGAWAFAISQLKKRKRQHQPADKFDQLERRYPR